ncbi:unnamed protein product [Allacma fusca]|uniref:Uncharacterized protein n=1 Tax=Allacma fusca TaxID=39272 RepID=A0A8J2MAZ3_9HEXA|nr:unnamed protein product [Allacma fusca]
MKTAMFCIWLILVVVVVHVHCQDDEMDEEKSEEYRQCNKERRRALVSLKKNLEFCDNDKTIEGSRCDPAVRGCLCKCVLAKEGILDENGAVTIEAVKEIVENRASGELQTRFLTLLEGCLQEHGSLIKPEDPACGGYEVFGHCLEGGIEKICEDPEQETTELEAAEAPKDEL